MMMWNDQLLSLPVTFAFDLPMVTTKFLRVRRDTRLPEKEKLCTLKTAQIISWCKHLTNSGRRDRWLKLTGLHLQMSSTEFTGSHAAAPDIKASAR
jgi:hypothetical protein